MSILEEGGSHTCLPFNGSSFVRLTLYLSGNFSYGYLLMYSSAEYGKQWYGVSNVIISNKSVYTSHDGKHIPKQKVWIALKIGIRSFSSLSKNLFVNEIEN